MFRRLVVLLISVAAFVVCLDYRNVRADPAGSVVASSSGDSTFVFARSRYVDAGDAFSCVILNDSSVKCFGLGADGQLGSGSSSNIGDGVGVSVSASAAIALGSGRTARAIATGAAHACALLDNNTIKCWGYGVDGALGYGDTTTRGITAASMGDSLGPVDLGNGRTARSITAGAQHTCALLDNGTVKCWGRGTSGQLGRGDTQTRGDGPGEMGDSATAIALGSGRTAKAIAAGANHTCALLDNDSIKCWGDNSYGQLGQGNLAAIGDGVGASVSAAAAIDLGSGRSAKAIAAGDAHTCALLDDGTVKCWGSGSNGRLGSGDTVDLGDDPGEMGDALIPVSLGTGRTAIALTAGASHTCALLDNYVVKCWGNGFDGRLGYGNQNEKGGLPMELGDNLAAVPLGTGRTARAVVAGAAHTCAILDDNSLKCWGNGGNGRRGSSSTLRAGHTALTSGDNLPPIDLGNGRAVNSLTEPGRPTTLSAVAGDAKVTLSWNAPLLDGGSAVGDYLVESSVDSGTTWSTVNDGVSASTGATVTGLTNATSYVFRLRAINDVAVGAPSSTSVAVAPTAISITTSTSTTSSTTSTSTTTPVVAKPSPTPTSSIATLPIKPIAVRIIPKLVLPPFAPYMQSLSGQQQQRLESYSTLLRRGDKVTCIGYATPNPMRVVSLLSIKRAETVCAYLAKRVRGIVTRIDTHIPTSPRTSSASVSVALPDNLERRVIVLATPKEML
ncbi:MAG: fibronectin type III domain-containing protein [Ilumatobacteraceae bacterium]